MPKAKTCARESCTEPITTRGAKYCSRSCSAKARNEKQQPTTYATSYEAGESPTACPECGSSQSTVAKKNTIGVVTRRYRTCKACDTPWQSTVIHANQSRRSCPHCHKAI